MINHHEKRCVYHFRFKCGKEKTLNNYFFGLLPLPGVCDKKGIYDLGLIIDGSGSLGNKFSTTIFLVGLINQFRVSKDEVRFGIIAYGSKPELVCQFSDMMCHHRAMDVKIMVMKMEFPDGERRTDKALMKAGKELYSSSGGHRTGVPSVLVVITDGKTVPGSQPYSDVLQPLKVDKYS